VGGRLVSPSEWGTFRPFSLLRLEVPTLAKKTTKKKNSYMREWISERCATSLDWSGKGGQYTASAPIHYPNLTNHPQCRTDTPITGRPGRGPVFYPGEPNESQDRVQNLICSDRKKRSPKLLGYGFGYLRLGGVASRNLRFHDADLSAGPVPTGSGGAGRAPGRRETSP